MNAPTNLATTEKMELARQEAIVERGFKTFVEVGAALLAIRENRLYREDYGTFEDYCRDRWGMNRRYANRIIGASEVVGNIENGSNWPQIEPPANESQARPLAKLPPNEQPEAWQEAVEKSGGKPTAKHVREVVEKRTQLPQHSTDSNDWYTPSKYIEAARRVLGGIDLDPASSEKANERVGATTFYTAKDNGLTKGWPGKVWLNPPYNQGDNSTAGNQLWVPRWHIGMSEGESEAGILLVWANTEVGWFQALWGYWLCFTDHRIHFERPDGSTGSSPPKGSVFAYHGDNPELFRKTFKEFGQIIPPT